MKNNLYLLQLIRHSEKQIREGKVTSQEEVFDKIEKKYFRKEYTSRKKYEK